ncbi:MAG: hypothetical protein FDZ69_00080 [Deltaproteobacteria bacterium]|nr:MAG: hypothetical protein FDZ69_00080 [Deltaproteobacteria bacterium]
MIDSMTIDFDGIGGITPMGSTYGDVLRLWGNLFHVEHRPAEVLSSGRVIKPKTFLNFKAMRTMISFSTDEPLQSETPIGMVGAETGCRLRTPKGLHVGLSKVRARAIASWFYRINRESSRDYVLYLDPLEGDGNTEIGVFFEDNKVDFIGVYRK